MPVCRPAGTTVLIRTRSNAAGLTPVPADLVNAPMVDECFMNLECRFRRKKEIAEGDDYVLACLEIVCAHIKAAA